MYFEIINSNHDACMCLLTLWQYLLIQNYNKFNYIVLVADAKHSLYYIISFMQLLIFKYNTNILTALCSCRQ